MRSFMYHELSQKEKLKAADDAYNTAS